MTEVCLESFLKGKRCFGNYQSEISKYINISVPCYACRPRQAVADLQKLLANGDVGIIIYRYRGSPIEENTGRDTIILVTTRKMEDHPPKKMKLAVGNLPKCINYCARCKQLMRRIEGLFRGDSAQYGDLMELFSCPPCTDTVTRFRAFAEGALIAHDSELIHLERLTEPHYDLDDQVRRLFNEANEQAGILTAKDKRKGTEAGVRIDDGKDRDGDKTLGDIRGKGFKISSTNVNRTEEGRPSEAVMVGKKVSKIHEEGAPDKVKENMSAVEVKGKNKESTAVEVEEKAKERMRTEAEQNKKGRTIEAEAAGKKRKITNEAEVPGKEQEKTTDIEALTRKALEAARKDANRAEVSGKRKEKTTEAGQGDKKKDLLSEVETSQKKNNAISDAGDHAKKKGKAIDLDPKSRSQTRLHKSNLGLRNAIKTGKTASDNKLTSKDPKGKSKLHLNKPFKETSVDRNLSGEVSGQYSTKSSPLLRKKNQEHMLKNKGDGEGEKRQKDAVNKMDEAKKASSLARVARQRAEDIRKLKFKKMMDDMALTESESDDHSVEEAAQEPEERRIIIGNRITTARGVKAVNSETVTLTQLALPTVTYSLLPPSHAPSHVNSDKTTLVQHFRPLNRILRYKLSDGKFIANGYTQLPKEIVKRKIAVFSMKPSFQASDWLQLTKHEGRAWYDSGEQLLSSDENGYTRMYYKNGELALQYYETEEELKFQESEGLPNHRVLVYSERKPRCGRARPRTVLAAFDYCGNGAVYNHEGHTRLKYTQNEGVVLDRSIGPHSHWQWHNLNETCEVHTIVEETLPKIRDPRILEIGELETTVEESPSNIAMMSIEVQNMLKEKKRLSKKYVPYQMKMKAFKINEYFSLRIMDQSTIFLHFSDGKTRLRINVGMVLDPKMVVAENFVAVAEVDNVLDHRPAVSNSVESLQRLVLKTRAAASRLLGERRSNTGSYVRAKRRKH